MKMNEAARSEYRVIHVSPFNSVHSLTERFERNTQDQGATYRYRKVEIANWEIKKEWKKNVNRPKKRLSHCRSAQHTFSTKKKM